MDKNKPPSIEEVRQRRLAYFQNTSHEADPAAGQDSDKQQKHGPGDKIRNKTGSESFNNLGEHDSLNKQASVPNTRSTKGVRTLRTGPENSNLLGQHDSLTKQAPMPNTRSTKGLKTRVRQDGGNGQPGKKYSGTRTTQAASTAAAAADDDMLSKDWNSHVEHLFRKGHQTGQETKTLSRDNSQELLRESQDLDAMSMFKSEVDCQDLGLSTHRPDSDRPSLDRNQNNNADLMENSLSQEMKNLLGASKYQEFVEKSVKDINELYQNKTTETSPHLIRSLIEEQTDVEHEKEEASHGRPETGGHMNNHVQSRSPRHRLNRPRKEPVHIQNLVAKTKQDLELEGSESLPSSAKNYEQITVAPKVTFSADEIYRQAYGSSGSQLQRGMPIQAMSYNQTMPFHPAMMMNMPSGSFQAPSVGFQSPQGAFQPPHGGFQSPHGHFPPDFTQPPPGMHGQPNPGMHGQPTPGMHGQPPPGMHGQPTQGMHGQPTPGMHGQPTPGMHGQPTQGMHGQPPGPYMYGGQPDMFTPRTPTTPTPASPHPMFYQPYMTDPGFHGGYQGYTNMYQSQPFSPPAYNTQYANYVPPVHVPHPPPQPPSGNAQQPPGVYYPPQVVPTVPHPPHPPNSPPAEVLLQTQNTAKDKSSKNVERAKARDRDKLQRKKVEDEREEGTPAPDRHIEAIRIHHEQRRQMQEDKMNEVFHMEKQKKFAQASLDRYFSSLENIYRPPTSPQGSLPQTEEEAEETPDEEPEDGEAVDDAGDEDAVDEDAFTSVTATSVKAGGITDRLERLGIDVAHIKSKDAVNEGDEDDKQKKRKKVKVCPACASWNKEYMSWCADCGEILIGVESIVAKRKERRKDNADRKDRTEHVEVKSENPTEQAGPTVSTRKSISISPEILSYRHDTDMKVSVTKPAQVDSHMKQLERVKREMAIPTTGSGATGNYIRSPKEINDLCEVISDPVIRGFIKNYFSRKAKADDDVEAETSDGKEQEVDVVTPKADVEPDLSDGEVILNLQSSESFDSPPPKHQKSRSNKYKNHGDIDVEIFDIQDSRESRTASRNAPVVPCLDLHDSSDDEEVIKARRLAMKTMPISFSIDTDDWSSVNESQQLNPAEESPDLPLEALPETDGLGTPGGDNSDEGNPSQDPCFLAHILAMRNNSSRSERQRPQSADLLDRKRMTQSIVRESIEAKPYQRHWEKSSIAWSSFHPRELSTRSSMKNFMMQDPRVKCSTSTENMATAETRRPDGRGAAQTHKKSRPASADLYRRKVQSSMRPASAQVRGNHQPRVRDTDPPNLSPSQTSVIAHRLPQEDHQPPMARTLQGPSAAITAYNMYMEMTPRIEEGEFSKWQCLPDEIWLYIFSFLPHSDLARMARACKQFCRISVDDSLWKHITVKKNHAICDQWLSQIAMRHPVSLALIQCHGDNVTGRGLRELFRECTDNLKELNFSRCSRGGLTGDSILLHASARCRHLTHVDASWCHVTDNGLTALSESAHRLESLCLNGCQMLSDEGVETVIKKHGSSLRVLELFGCFNLTPRCIRCIATHCTNLLTINLGQCFRLTDSSITHLSASLGRVENLDLRGCKQIRDNCIRKIVRNCPRLKTIIIANCPHVSDAALVEIATYSMDVRSLDICGCRNVTDHSIRTLSNNCQRLTQLDISSSGCSHRSVTLLASYCNRNLETLKLNFLADITEVCLQKLVKNCKKLKTLHLYGCTSVRSIDKLKQLCPFLHVEM
ncbi:uncharacterized protein LOC124117572 [Haliotis rufescens]|uniref:uncharacterized protein LOC124117572 n=1 Tax=Haliotis rufescens TaxID=6454 RepID=UPI00201ED67C|nr:uncharacterized protein LOC124117572 [Haliotis rufescens]